MNCKDVRENLIELLADGSADAAVTSHVKECSSCSQELESLRKTMALLDEWEVPEASPYFLTRLQAHVREERNKAPQGWFGWLRRPITAVSLAAVLAGGAVFYQLRPQVKAVNHDLLPPAPAGSAVADLEALEKNHDLYVNSDLIDEITGGPSSDISED
jgi:anti-sigma factor RsiW